MKKSVIFIIGVLITGLIACSGNPQSESSEKDSTKTTSTTDQKDQTVEIIQTVDIGCVQCQMGKPCKEHKLAAKIAENVYYVEGAGAEKLAEYDYCSVIKKAKLKGHIKDSTFIAESIEIEKK